MGKINAHQCTTCHPRCQGHFSRWQMVHFWTKIAFFHLTAPPYGCPPTVSDIGHFLWGDMVAFLKSGHPRGGTPLRWGLFRKIAHFSGLGRVYLLDEGNCPFWGSVIGVWGRDMPALLWLTYGENLPLSTPYGEDAPTRRGLCTVRM